ncbi:MAG: hypothetical protein Q7S68_05515 [Deltaproteobacteria bacterium]|nr:hypothetical protein [Deltaproteobacteria bacterium]
MALSQKYTWADFLKANPDAKKSSLKRTSKEGIKAFEAAYQIFIKGYTAKKQEELKKEKTRVTKEKTELVTELKKLDGKKWAIHSKRLNQKVGRLDAYLAKVEKANKEYPKKLKAL